MRKELSKVVSAIILASSLHSTSFAGDNKSNNYERDIAQCMSADDKVGGYTANKMYNWGHFLTIKIKNNEGGVHIDSIPTEIFGELKDSTNFGVGEEELYSHKGKSVDARVYREFSPFSGSYKITSINVSRISPKCKPMINYLYGKQ